MKFNINKKLTIFILLLLTLNILLISIFALKGIRNYQRRSYEAILKESSKTANLYIREKYLSQNDLTFQEFYMTYGKDIQLELERILNLNVKLYGMDGQLIEYLLSYNINKPELQQDKVINTVLQNKIAYVKKESYIIYGAPIYDFNKQIGVIKIRYNRSNQVAFYKDIKRILYQVGLISMCITFIIAWSYFSRIVRRIKSLRTSIKDVKHGNYELVQEFKSYDELGELSTGIKEMSNKIQNNIKEIQKEKTKLEKAVIHLQKLEKKQREFIGNITHEFKTPITVVKAQLDLINLYNDDEELFRNSVSVANKELIRLNDMIENILYLSRMEKYEYELHKKAIRGDLLLHDIIKRMKAKAGKYSISIEENIQPATLIIDEESYMQILINLIDNAIKYNNYGGKIIVRGYIDNKYYIIEVEDTGIGISDDNKNRIFEPFYIVDKNRSKEYSGTGLGLSLVKKLLKKQKGYIGVKDGEKGTIFIVKIPLCIKK
jgi:signal transduction histidine kinase